MSTDDLILLIDLSLFSLTTHSKGVTVVKVKCFFFFF